MSSVALSNKFIKTFPKRTAWYGDFFKPQKARMHVVLAGVLSPVLFLLVVMVSLQVAVTLGSYQPTAPVASASVSVPAPTLDPLTASVNDAVRFYHMPGAYIDTSTVVPTLERPQFPVSDADVARAAALAPYFAQSVHETVAAGWDKTFGLGGRVFVATVYEFGDQSAGVAQSELNVSDAWSQYIDGLSTLLEPYVQN